MPYAYAVLVKLLVLVSLAFALGDVRHELLVADAVELADELSLAGTDSDVALDVFVMEPAITRALPSPHVVLVQTFIHPPLSFDASRVFRPPRALVA